MSALFPGYPTGTGSVNKNGGACQPCSQAFRQGRVVSKKSLQLGCKILGWLTSSMDIVVFHAALQEKLQERSGE